ncbi:Anaphase-promoting complex subunit 11 [Anopheles sinensis]|uniref:Anaphase-promoting complex subunit 11 n=1 Tax=Anopheles sinensis TaxID=74873 RepID=A0A084VH26_ANOSI|nr:Anaphase-promoting complex subunit 11 [Anopheles sinensis]
MNGKVKDWRGVSFWKRLMNDDVCGICLEPCDASCPNCEILGEPCPPAFGFCSHCFHMHCILKWVISQGNGRCPKCRKEWNFACP